jgi:hypothetical protein
MNSNATINKEESNQLYAMFLDIDDMISFWENLVESLKKVNTGIDNIVCHVEKNGRGTKQCGLRNFSSIAIGTISLAEKINFEIDSDNESGVAFYLRELCKKRNGILKKLQDPNVNFPQTANLKEIQIGK